MTRARDIANFGDGIATADIGDGQITTAKIADGDVTSAKLFSGFANGITEADQWRITSNLTLTTTGVQNVTANWERVDNSGFGYIGTGMSESSGIFTFPSTGIYHISATGRFHADTTPDVEWAAFSIYVTTDGTNYEQITEVYGSMYNSNAYGNGTSAYIFDVTNTSTHKVRFACKREAGTPLLSGNTAENQTHVTFIRLGDT